MNQSDAFRYALGIIALPLSLVLLVVGVRMIIQGRKPLHKIRKDPKHWDHQ